MEKVRAIPVDFVELEVTGLDHWLFSSGFPYPVARNFAGRTRNFVGESFWERDCFEVRRTLIAACKLIISDSQQFAASVSQEVCHPLFGYISADRHFTF